jgi:hypothetical protein
VVTAVVLVEALKGVFHKGFCIFRGLLRLAALLGSSPTGHYRGHGRHPESFRRLPLRGSRILPPSTGGDKWIREQSTVQLTTVGSSCKKTTHPGV